MFQPISCCARRANTMWWGLALLLAIMPSAGAAADFNLAESRKSVVFIRTMAPNGDRMEGSGFIVSADGLI